ncbi:MAG: hypothetical protein JSR55_07940 [Proteobacteria bacterium]|nr:hypothetical protein [Pseudomonadota bacterium]
MDGTQPDATLQAPASGDTRMLVIICYGLFLLAFTNGLSAIAGVVLAHIKRADARGTIWETHFANAIHVFWIGVAFWVAFFAAALAGVAGTWHMAIANDFYPPMLALPLLGLALLVYVVWYLYRIVRGLLRALENKPYV